MSKTILLADDSTTIQKVVSIIFADLDYRVISFGNGVDALEAAMAEKPDIILADASMPGINGYELCDAVKKDPDLKGVPVVLLAGTFEPFDEQRASDVGSDGFLNKPFSSDGLLDRVAELLARAPVSNVGLNVIEDFGVIDDTLIPQPPAEDAPLAESVLQEKEEVDPWAAISFDEADLGMRAPSVASPAFSAVVEEPAAVASLSEDAADFCFDNVSTVDEPQPEAVEEEVLELAEEDVLELAPEDVLEEPTFNDVPVADPFDSSSEEAFIPPVADPFAEVPAEPMASTEDEFIFEVPKLEDSASLESSESAFTFIEDEAAADLSSSNRAVSEEETFVLSGTDESASSDMEEAFVFTNLDENVVEDVDGGLCVNQFDAPSLEQNSVAEQIDQEGYVDPFSSSAAVAAEELSFDEPATEAVAPKALLFEEPAAEAVDSPVIQPASTVSSAVEVEIPVRPLSDDELCRIAERVANDVIEKLAGTLLERIAWEVVPDLAESIIREEIRKIKEKVSA